MKLKFEYENNVIEFNIIRRKRKTLCISINEYGEVSVIAPLRISKEYILTTVKNKVNWIIKKQNEVKIKSSKKITRQISEGSTFMYLGEEYPLHLIFDDNIKSITVELKDESDINLEKVDRELNIDSKNKSNSIISSRKRFIIHTNTKDKDKIKIALEKWYREKTLEIVTKKISYYQSIFKDKVTDIRVKEQKRRWASCTGKNAILFNWRCSMAREDVLEYIVIHEMSHIDYKNHSKDFWNRVEEIMPNYREKHEWLKTNGINMKLE